jgi:hypothetical protein
MFSYFECLANLDNHYFQEELTALIKKTFGVTTIHCRDRGL